ncbi:MAG TPA: hypothetical protein VHT53_11630 [Candidatus Elarobacter sp.]|nr:hypothetical protein [Candidatus Elarobacter sp.]
MHPAAKPRTAAVAKQPAKKPVKVAARCKVAPADEYFGKLKMSILGIRNTIKDQGLKIDVDPGKAPSTMGSIALTEDAIRDWQHKYPCDSWIPGTLLALERFYCKIHTDDGVKRVHATFAWLRHDFPRNGIVQVAKREDGQATAVAPGPATAAIVPGPAAPPGPASLTSSASAPPAAGQSPATPFPGTAPQSVINAQNAMGTSPSPAPHK